MRAGDDLGSGFTGMSGLVLAADYPERVRSLVIVIGAARVLWAPDYPVGADASAADVRDTLPRITAPTLIVHRENAAFVGVGHGRYLAEHIPGSRYVELPGADSLHWTGDTAPVLDEIEEFITGVRGGFDAERVLTTIVFTDIVGSTQRAAELGDLRWHDLLDNHESIVRHQLERFRGCEVNTAGDGFVATFTSPSVAIDCADAIVDAVRSLGIEVRVGIHAGEVEVRGTSPKQDVAGMAVHIGARVAALAGPSEVLVSSTVREIVTGSRRTFVERGEHELRACRAGGGCIRLSANRLRSGGEGCELFGRLLAAVLLTQRRLEHLAGGVAEQFRHVLDAGRALEVRQAFTGVADQIVVGHLRAVVEGDDGDWRLCPHRVRHAHRGDLTDCRMAVEHLLDLDRVNVLPAGRTRNT